jgi:ATP-dependent exoDNAse (exonuclease V) alpha subunit
MNKLYYEFIGTPIWDKLTKGQQAFFEAVFQGKNVFLTGSAGTGKSFCFKTLFEFTQTKNFAVAKTASTGIAALTIGGSTIHSFAGLGKGDENVQSIIHNIKKYKKARQRITNVKRLCLDEVSMIDSSLLDKLDIILKYFRGNNEPFGGVQMIFGGDALQLPPVLKNKFHENAGFAFEARSWKEAKIHVCHLTEIKRQDAEGQFAKALNKIRFGDISDLSVILQREGNFFENDIVKPIKLFPTNKNVDYYNVAQLNAIKSEDIIFHAVEFGEARHLEALDKNCLAPKTLTIKIGAQVILLANLDTDHGWVNGTLAKVVGIENNLPVIQRDNGDKIIVDKEEWTIKETIVLPNGDTTYPVIASRKQIPLKLGWAITVHKSQSLTLDKVEIDFEGTFECAQVYVALSRARTLEGLSIKNLKPQHIRAHPKCVEFYSSLESV